MTSVLVRSIIDPSRILVYSDAPSVLGLAPIKWWTGKRLHGPAPTGLRAVIIRGLRSLIRLLERRDRQPSDTHSSMVVASPPRPHLAKFPGPSRPT